MKVLEMNDKLFRQRRRVIDALYEAKRVLGMELPRIKVRIVEFNEKEQHVLGVCFIEKDYISISHQIVSWNDDMVRHVVWHELGHAWFKAKHDESCPLMHPICNEGKPVEVLIPALKRIANK